MPLFMESLEDEYRKIRLSCFLVRKTVWSASLLQNFIQLAVPGQQRGEIPQDVEYRVSNKMTDKNLLIHLAQCARESTKEKQRDERSPLPVTS